jgi:hypothetical protein
MSQLENVIRKEIENGREIYTTLSPTKRVRLLEVYPANGRLEVVVEVVESEFSSDGAGNRLNMTALDVARILGY